ncbi:MAG: hypothetical protein PUB01_06705 [Desulfovibrionaceae bacterium]|nr:hypothetical protein [Desulfovibrionaceae bacterium]
MSDKFTKDNENKIDTEESLSAKSTNISTLFFYLLTIYITGYFIFAEHSFFGLFYIAPLSNNYFTYLLVAILTFFLARHVIQIKLVLYRIFLQTFLDIESGIYKFFSHGYVVRVIAAFVAFALSVNILTFFALTSVHKSQYIFLCLAITEYVLFNKKSYSGHSAIRKDVNSVLKQYLIPFMIASIAAMGVSTYNLITMEPVVAQNIGELLKTTLEAIDNRSVSWPLRVIIKHLYIYELTIQQVMNFPFFGKPIYFIYTIISEGVMTYFSILMLIMPYRRNEQ